jgi:hypothetical protein
MNFDNENIGYVERTQQAFIQHLNGETREFELLPPILRDIAPEPTQFPAADDVLEYYGMDRMDVWEYLARSNGFKSSRNVWFMSEPVGEVWIPLVIGMQEKSSYGAFFKVGDKIRVLMSGRAYINNHTIDILPSYIKPYLKRDGDTRFSTATGYVKDLVKERSTKGLIGRIVLNLNNGVEN